MSIDVDGTYAPPTAGTRATLLGRGGGYDFAATVDRWTGTEADLVMTARLATSAEAVQQLADKHVWMSVRMPGHGFVVYSGIARPVGSQTLDVTMVVPLAREPRRDALRVPLDGHVRITGGPRAPQQMRIVDLSRGGVRIVSDSTHPAGVVSVGDRLTLEIQVDARVSVPATGEVIRVDEQGREASVRFDVLPDHHGAEIDRLVLSRLGPRT